MDGQASISTEILARYAADAAREVEGVRGLADSPLPRRHAVRVSGVSDHGAVISEGLTGKERVVATAGGFLRDGEQVKVAPAATPAS